MPANLRLHLLKGRQAVIKKKGTKVPVSLCVCFAERQAEIKERNQKKEMPVCLCLCTFIEIRKGTKNLDFVLCTVVYMCGNIYYGLEKNNKQGVNQSNQATPSIWAWGKSSSGIRVVIMAAFPRIKLREYLWNRWEVAIDSS